MACLLAPILQLSFANLMDLYKLLTLPRNGSSDYIHNDHASLLASVSLLYWKSLLLNLQGKFYRRSKATCLWIFLRL